MREIGIKTAVPIWIYAIGRCPFLAQKAGFNRINRLADLSMAVFGLFWRVVESPARSSRFQPHIEPCICR